jgi:hypothetical protein
VGLTSSNIEQFLALTGRIVMRRSRQHPETVKVVVPDDMSDSFKFASGVPGHRTPKARPAQHPLVPEKLKAAKVY